MKFSIQTRANWM